MRVQPARQPVAHIEPFDFIAVNAGGDHGFGPRTAGKYRALEHQVIARRQFKAQNGFGFCFQRAFRLIDFDGRRAM